MAAIAALSLGSAIRAEPNMLAEGYGTLSKPTIKHLVQLFADIEPMLADSEAVGAYFAGLATFHEQQFYISGQPGAEGIYALDLDRRPEQPATTTLSLIFADAEDRSRFRMGLERVLGAPDAACTDESNINWSPAPNLSIFWRTVDWDEPEVQIDIRAADPLDANCARSATPRDHLVNEERMAAFLARLRDDPPPFHAPKAMTRWLQSYGALTVTNRTCPLTVTMPPYDVAQQIERLPGIGFLIANVDNCGPEENYGLSYIVLSSHLAADMFAIGKITLLADAAFGAPLPGCSDAYQTVWAIDEKTSLLLSDTYLSFSAIIYDAPPSFLGCSDRGAE